jgi:hypothetical protein
MMPHKGTQQGVAVLKERDTEGGYGLKSGTGTERAGAGAHSGNMRPASMRM